MKKTLLMLFLLLMLSLAGCQPVADAPTPTAAPASTAEIISTSTPLPSPTESTDTDLNATLQEVEGSVEAKDLSEIDFTSAADGRTIQEEGQVRTLDDGYTRVDLSTGTLIRMAPQSYFVLVQNQPEDESLLTRIKLELGQIWVVLNGGSLEVETPSGQAAVRGSYMMVEIDPDTQEELVTCLEGNCTLENPAGIIELVNGQRAKLQPPELTDGEFKLPPVEGMSERDFAEWLFFAPEAEAIFPLLQEENLLPWDDWQDYIPEDDQNWRDLEELFPDAPLLDGSLLPDDGSLLGEDGTLLDGIGDGSNLPGDGILPGGDGDGILPGGGDGDGPGPFR